MTVGEEKNILLMGSKNRRLNDVGKKVLKKNVKHACAVTDTKKEKNNQLVVCVCVFVDIFG